MPSGKYRLIADLPLDQAHGFNFDQIAITLFRFITDEQNSTPLNICIDGTWGSGKTSLMKILQRSLEEKESATCKQDPQELRRIIYVPLWFEPWKLADEQEVLNSLVSLVLRKIQDDAGPIASAQIEVDRKDALRVLSQRLFQINPDELSASYQWSSRLQGSFTEIEDLFRRVAKAYLEAGQTERRFVVFIDDLDRCPPPRVVTVLETVKLFFNMPGFLFVFGMDKTQIEQSVCETYKHFEDADAKVYLEKMFQLSYPLPVKTRDSLVDFVSDSMRDMDLEVQDRALLQALVDTFGRNLRSLKLFLNSFNFKKRLISDAGTDRNDEVLLKWFLIETMLPASMDIAIASGSPSLLVALEFLSQGAVLYNPKKYNEYKSSLVQERMQYLPLIVWALLPPSESDDKYDDSKLDSEQQRIVDALRRDGKVPYILSILREGNELLLDQDLAGLAYLTRMETLKQESSLRGDPKGTEVLTEFEGGSFILSDADWSSQGDKFYNRMDYRSAYCTYLLALLLDFDSIDSAIYWIDMATVYRKFGYRDAALALFKQAYRLKPQSLTLYSQLALLYDFDDDDDYHASLLYRKAIALGSVEAACRYNLALNLKILGDYKRAFVYALDAYRLEPQKEKRRERAQRYAKLIDKTELNFEKWNEDLGNELQRATDENLIPYPLSTDEEKTIDSMISEYPDIAQSRNQIRSWPVL